MHLRGRMVFHCVTCHDLLLCGSRPLTSSARTAAMNSPAAGTLQPAPAAWVTRPAHLPSPSLAVPRFPPRSSRLHARQPLGGGAPPSSGSRHCRVYIVTDLVGHLPVVLIGVPWCLGRLSVLLCVCRWRVLACEAPSLAHFLSWILHVFLIHW